MLLSDSIKRQQMSQENILAGYWNKMYKTKNKVLIDHYATRIIRLGSKINQMSESYFNQLDIEQRQKNEVN